MSEISTRQQLAGARPTFGDVLRVKECRSLLIASIQSAVGDQLAKVALTALIFERTGSVALAALAYALAFLPPVMGGILLSGLADRFSRRALMVWCDVLRAVLFALMALPGLPGAALCLLFVVAVLLGSPFSAAQSAILPDILTGECYVVAVGLRNVAAQMAQVVGFACGGLAVAALGTSITFLGDGLTFGVSALLLFTGVSEHRPELGPNDDPSAAPKRFANSLGTSIRYLQNEPVQRARLALAWVFGVFMVPEGIAVPLAHELRGGTKLAGLLLAIGPLGAGIGAFVVLRLMSEHRRTLVVGPLAVASGVPLMACFIVSSPVSALCALFASGLCTGYLGAATAAFTQAVPSGYRGQIVGIAWAGLQVSQGVAILTLGAIGGELIGEGTTVGLAGVMGSLLAVFPAIRLGLPKPESARMVTRASAPAVASG
jgi:predicted MFS family arabinose efflux permease